MRRMYPVLTLVLILSVLGWVTALESFEARDEREGKRIARATTLGEGNREVYDAAEDETFLGTKARSDKWYSKVCFWCKKDKKKNNKDTGGGGKALKKYKPYHRYSIPGNNHKKVEGSPETCAKACESHDWCKTFDYKAAKKPYCYLSRARGPLTGGQGKIWTCYVRNKVKPFMAGGRGRYEKRFSTTSTTCKDGRDFKATSKKNANLCAKYCLDRVKKHRILSFDYNKKSKVCHCLQKATAFCSTTAVEPPTQHYEFIRKGSKKDLARFTKHRNMYISGIKRSGAINYNLDAAQCASLCYKKRKRCSGFSWKRWSYQCHLFKNARDGRLTKHKFYDSFIMKHTAENSISKYQSSRKSCTDGLLQKKGRIWSADKCAKLCEKMKKKFCLSFDYSGSTGKCHLYTKTTSFCKEGETPAKFTHYELKREKHPKAYNRFEVKPGQVRGGHALKTMYNLNDHECAHACVSNKWCRGFNWRKYEYKCLLLNDVDRPLTKNQFTDAFTLKKAGFFDKIMFWKDTPFADAGKNHGEILAQFTGPEAAKISVYRWARKKCYAAHNRKTYEQCAMLCLEETKFKCRAFMFTPKDIHKFVPDTLGKCTLFADNKSGYCKRKGVFKDKKSKKDLMFTRKRPFKKLVDISENYAPSTEKDSAQESEQIRQYFTKSDDEDLKQPKQKGRNRVGPIKPKATLYSTTPYKCMSRCLRPPNNQWCKGFTYQRSAFKCYLWASSAEDKGLTSKKGFDHYQRYFKSDKVIKKAIKFTDKQKNYEVRGEAFKTLKGVSLYRCAHTCLLNAQKKPDGVCRGFNYEKYEWTCKLLSGDVIKSHKPTKYNYVDFYTIEDWDDYETDEVEGSNPDNTFTDQTVAEPVPGGKWPLDDHDDVAEPGLPIPDPGPRWENPVNLQNWIRKKKPYPGLRFNGHNGAEVPSNLLRPTENGVSVSIEFRMQGNKASGTLLGFTSTDIRPKWGTRRRDTGTLALFVNTAGLLCGDTSANSDKDTLLQCGDKRVTDGVWHVATLTLGADSTQALYLDGARCGSNKAHISNWNNPKSLQYAWLGVGRVSSKLPAKHIVYHEPHRNSVNTEKLFIPTPVQDYFYLFGDITFVKIWPRVLTGGETGGMSADKDALAIFTFEEGYGYDVGNKVPDGPGHIKFLPLERAPYYSQPRAKCKTKCANEGMQGPNCECWCVGLWQGPECKTAFVTQPPQFDRFWSSDRWGLLPQHPKYRGKGGLVQGFGRVFWNPSRKNKYWDLSGGNRHVYRGKYNNQHTGIDVGCLLGETMHAMAQGIVVQAGWSEAKDGYCCTPYSVTVRSGNRYAVYGHLAEILVKKGDVVEMGALLGLSGPPRKISTGKGAFGYHLHLEMHPVAARVLLQQARLQEPTGRGIALNPYNEFSPAIQKVYASSSNAHPSVYCSDLFNRSKPVYLYGGRGDRFNAKMRGKLTALLKQPDKAGDFSHCTCYFPGTTTPRTPPIAGAGGWDTEYFGKMMDTWCSAKPKTL